MAFLLAALMATSAAAAPKSDATPEVVIITASPLGDASDALSQGVSVVSRSDAANASITGGIGEAISGVPGVRATFYGPNASRPIIRGLGEDRIRLMLNGLAGIDASMPMALMPQHKLLKSAIQTSKRKHQPVLKGVFLGGVLVGRLSWIFGARSLMDLSLLRRQARSKTICGYSQ